MDEVKKVEEQQDNKDLENQVETQSEERQAEEKKYTDAEVDEIVKSKLAKWKKDEERKISEAEKLAKMDEAEKAEYRTKQLEEELEELKSERNKNEMLSVARNMLQENSISVSDDLISAIIAEDADKTKANIKSFIDGYVAAVEKGVTERLKSTPPKRMTGGKVLSKDEIFKVKDPVERRKLIAENIELFN